jgi:hypothetical protein
MGAFTNTTSWSEFSNERFMNDLLVYENKGRICL